MWKRASLLAGLLVVAAAFAGLLLLAPAPARTTPPGRAAAHAHPPSAVRKLRPPRAERVRPRAFASSPGLIRYPRGHFAVTHARPHPPCPPVSDPLPAPAPSTP